MNILIYVRKWNKEYFTDVITKTFTDCRIIYYSDFKELGNIWTGDFIYSEQKADYNLDETEKRDIYQRCRFLRTRDYENADVLITKLYCGLMDYFNHHNIDLIITQIIDCYTLDVLCRTGIKQKIPVISFVQNFIRGYSRFTIRGERIDLNRDVTADEIEAVYNMLNNDSYKPDFSLNKRVYRTDLFKRWVKNWVKCNIYYKFKMMITSDKDNYHYNAAAGDFTQILKRTSDTLFYTLNTLDNNMEYVYLPLHFTPEATVDYWCKELENVDYEKSIIDFINSFPDKFCILIKEHPAMFGRRNFDFYEVLLNRENVKLVHPYEDSNKILGIVDTVIVHTGSVGVEALLRNKRVLCLTENYYSDLHPNAHYLRYITEDSLNVPIVEYDNKKFVKDLLQSMFQFKYSAGWDVKKKSDDIEILSRWIKYYYRRISKMKE